MIFDGLGSERAKRAYDLAAYLHDGVSRKNGEPYLVHINRSLQELDKSIDFIGNKYNLSWYQAYICLHDIIEDNEDGVELIEKEFGIETVISVLWMSIPKKRVREGVEKLIRRKPEYSQKLWQFTAIYMSCLLYTSDAADE